MFPSVSGKFQGRGQIGEDIETKKTVFWRANDPPKVFTRSIMQSQLENNPFEHRLNKFCFGLGASVFQNHPTPSRRLNFLDIILSATIIAVAFIILGEILGSDPSAPILGFNFLTGFACLGLGYWVHKSSAQWGGLIFLGLVFIYNTCALVNLDRKSVV